MKKKESDLMVAIGGFLAELEGMQRSSVIHFDDAENVDLESVGSLLGRLACESVSLMIGFSLAVNHDYDEAVKFARSFYEYHVDRISSDYKSLMSRIEKESEVFHGDSYH